jgi:hypothetical protein
MPMGALPDARIADLLRVGKIRFALSLEKSGQPLQRAPAS